MKLSKQRATTFDTCPWFSDEIFAQWIINNIKHLGSSICDLGAGTGIMATYYKSYFKEVIAVEPSENMLEILTGKFANNTNVIIKNGGAESIPITDNGVDIVVSKSALHHYKSIDVSLQEMSRVSKKVVVIIEVIAPSHKCIPFLKHVVLMKEYGRNPNTIFQESDLIGIISKITPSYRSLHFDQYIVVDKWLENSDLNFQEQKLIYDYISSQKGNIKELMHIHYINNQLVMLRRMNMLIGVHNV